MYKPPTDGITGDTHPITLRLSRADYDKVHKMATVNKITITKLLRHMIQYCLDGGDDTK